MQQDATHQPINGTAWANVDIDGSVTKNTEFRLQDDFHAAVNRDWLATAQILPGNTSESAFWERMREVESQIQGMLKGEVDVPESHEADLARALYGKSLDMDARDALGVAPLQPYIDRVRAIGSLDELTKFVTTDGKLFSEIGVGAGVFADKRDSMSNVVYIEHSPFSLQDANEYRDMTPMGERFKAAMVKFVPRLLTRLGFSQAESEQIMERFYSLEERIAVHCLGADARGREDYEEITYNAYDASQLLEASPHYPLMAFLGAIGFGDSRRFVLEEPEWLEAIDSLYTEENLEDFKAMMLVDLVTTYASSLDNEAYKASEECRNDMMGSQGLTPLERKAYNVCNAELGMAVGKMYVDCYLKDETKQAVESLIAEVIDTYRERLSNTGWLSQTTRERAIEKLDALVPRVGRPDVWPEYEKLVFDPDMNLLEMKLAIAEFELERQRKKVNQPVDKEEWYMDPQTVNACYIPTDNTINIPAGILGGVFFDESGTREQLMGGIGMVIGHEITHAFDRNGSLYDKNGNMGESWWDDEDRAEFKQRTDAVAEYWNNIEVLPGINVDGNLCVTEVVADLGGMTCMCSIAHKHIEKGEGFDFVKMFESFARDWRIQEPEQIVEYLVNIDVHAPAHLRTNGTVQMLQEFYDAFDVQPGDGMYLEPERRLQVW